MLGITMQLDISARMTPQVTTIICHHIIIMLAFTNHLGRTKPNLKTKILLPISQKKPPHIIKIIKINLLLLNHPPKPQVKNALNV